VDETADLDRAAQSIVQGAGFYNCIACSSEKEMFVVQSVGIRKMAAKASCASFVKNGACGLQGVGVTGEGCVFFHTAANGEGHTRPRKFTRTRRCVMADDLRY